MKTLILLALSTVAGWAADLHQIQIGTDVACIANGVQDSIKAYPYSPVGANFGPWINNTGQTVYVVKVVSYISVSPQYMGKVVAFVRRLSDGSSAASTGQLQYIGWPVCGAAVGGFDGSPQDFAKEDNFEPDAWTIAPGDGLRFDVIATSQSWADYAIDSVYIWYRLTP
jgi:hypothetical protein